MVYGFIIIIIMLILSIINDFKNRKIKNIIPLTFSIIGIIFNIIYLKNNLLWSFLLNVIFLICLYVLPKLCGVQEFMGAGDIKIFMAISFIMGWKYATYTFLYSIIVGGIILLIINFKRVKEIGFNIGMFVMSKGKWIFDESNNKTNIFTPYILIGSIIAYFYSNDWLVQIFNFK